MATRKSPGGSPTRPDLRLTVYQTDRVSVRTLDYTECQYRIRVINPFLKQTCTVESTPQNPHFELEPVLRCEPSTYQLTD